MTVVLALLSDKSNLYFQSDGAVLFGSDTQHLKVDRLLRYQGSPNTSLGFWFGFVISWIVIESELFDTRYV